jgi:hypothetical protein
MYDNVSRTLFCKSVKLFGLHNIRRKFLYVQNSISQNSVIRNISVVWAIHCLITADSHNIFECTRYSSPYKKRTQRNYCHYNKLHFKENNSLWLRYKFLCAIRISLVFLCKCGVFFYFNLVAFLTMESTIIWNLLHSQKRYNLNDIELVKLIALIILLYV